MLFYFFESLYKKRSKLFYLFIAFFSLQFFFIFIKWEATPFFLYGMFSEKTAFPDTFHTKTILINGRNIKTFNLSQKELWLIEETVEHYMDIKNNKGKDIVMSRVETKYPLLYPSLKTWQKGMFNKPVELTEFEGWLRKKCAKITDRNDVQITVKHESYLISKERNALKPLTSETIASF
jgi:hypothetical protein